MLIKNASLYLNRSFVHTDLLVENGRILRVGSAEGYEGACFDADGGKIVPGLIDVHTHGRAGYDFTACSEEALHVMAADYARHGVTTVMPTLASAPWQEMLTAFERLARFAPKEGEASFCGVHLEGRYLNPAKRGAHAERLLSPLAAEELNQPVFGLCPWHLSAAFELDEDGSFAKQAKEMGATLGLGHTMATYAEAKKAEAFGVSSYTHLFNAMPPLHHREGGAICAALEGDCFAELICDGIHVSEEMVRLATRAKGVEHITLISDSMEATDCIDGSYSIGGQPVTVRNGIARTLDGALAGSTLTLDRALANFMKFCGLSLCDAIVSATETPARQMGIFEECGSLAEGKRADLLLLEDAEVFSIRRVMLRGEWLTDKENRI